MEDQQHNAFSGYAKKSAIHHFKVIRIDLLQSGVIMLCKLSPKAMSI